MAAERVPLMGLYEASTRNGSKYLRGKLGRAMIWVFRNERKTKETEPDWTVYVAADNRDSQQPGQAASQPAYQPRSNSYGSGGAGTRAPVGELPPPARPSPAPATEPAPWESGGGSDDDIPF